MQGRREDYSAHDLRREEARDIHIRRPDRKRGRNNAVIALSKRLRDFGANASRCTGSGDSIVWCVQVFTLKKCTVLCHAVRVSLRKTSNRLTAMRPLYDLWAFTEVLAVTVWGHLLRILGHRADFSGILLFASSNRVEIGRAHV